MKMAMKTEKDRHKAQQEKFQAILSALLKDEDNKYCEDCDAKGLCCLFRIDFVLVSTIPGLSLNTTLHSDTFFLVTHY
jgi:hypothetical protein